MKYSLLAAMAALSCLSMVPGAHAADHPYYAGVKGDVAFPSNSDAKGTTTGPVKYGFSSGAGVVLGWQPPALDTQTGDVRVELEGSYHAMSLDHVAANTSPSGDLKATTLMGNAYYDFHNSSRFTPYVGAGVGQAFVSFPKNAGLNTTDKKDNVLAYQAMAGVSYNPASLPCTDWTVGYKYLGFENPSFKSASGQVKLDPMRESAIEVGMRYRF